MYNCKRLLPLLLILFFISSISVKVKIYPNPTNNIIYVQGLSDIENNIVELYDVQGNLILRKEMLGNGMIDLAEFANGIYVIKVGWVFQRIAKM